MHTKEDILKALEQVQDPEIHKSIVELGMVKNLEVIEDKVTFTLNLTTIKCTLKQSMAKNAEEILKKIGIKSVVINFAEMTQKEKEAIGMGGPHVLPKGEIKNIIAIGSGKGGVGKSTVVTNLAIALVKQGQKVGVLDADVLGPNIPVMFNTNQHPVGDDKYIIPIEKYGVKIISIGVLTQGTNEPIVWRGPMISNAIQQLYTMTKWGELDFLLIDLPPGTSDAMLTVGQSLPLNYGLVVTMPAKVSTDDATRFYKTFEKLEVPVMGIIENMSFFKAPDTGTVYPIFGEGGGTIMAKNMNAPLLAQIPIDQKVSSCGNEQAPVVIADPTSFAAEHFMKLAKEIIQK
ncbi:MAG: Mrp/NBP35 family ATP-binding protein [Caldisericia bacterium]|nr:Mrp/NBP35 family ATP-binding protein [Caldisericia bacterium]